MNKEDGFEKDLSKYGLNFPVVVKTSCGGSSVGVYIVNNQKEYEDALADASQYGDGIVVEEYIKGREFSVAVVDGKAYPISRSHRSRDFMITRTNIRQEAPSKPARQSFPRPTPPKCRNMP